MFICIFGHITNCSSGRSIYEEVINLTCFCSFEFLKLKVFRIINLSIATYIWTTLCIHESVKIPPSPLESPLCNFNTFKASYFNRLVKIWNYTCKVLPPTTFTTLSSFKRSGRLGSCFLWIKIVQVFFPFVGNSSRKPHSLDKFS